MISKQRATPAKRTDGVSTPLLLQVKTARLQRLLLRKPPVGAVLPRVVLLRDVQDRGARRAQVLVVRGGGHAEARGGRSPVLLPVGVLVRVLARVVALVDLAARLDEAGARPVGQRREARAEERAPNAGRRAEADVRVLRRRLDLGRDVRAAA